MPVQILDEFDRIPKSYRRKLCYEWTNVFFGSLEWFECLWETIREPGFRLRIYLHISEVSDAPTCALVFYTTGKPRELYALANFYTIEFLPVVRQDRDVKPQLAEIIGHILAETPSWRSVRVPLLDTRGALYHALTDSQLGKSYVTYPYSATMRFQQDLSGSDFAQYCLGRPSRLKNTVARRSKKLTKEHPWDIRVTFSDTDATMAVADFKKVYDRSWKDREFYPGFIDRLVRAGIPLRAVVLGVLYVADSPVAAQIWLRSGADYTIYKLAYDEAFKAYSVGSILTLHIFSKIMASGNVETIDFGVGNEYYKSDWLSETSELVSLEVCSRYGIKGFVSRLKTKGWRHASAPRGLPSGA